MYNVTVTDNNSVTDFVVYLNTYFWADITVLFN